MPETENHPNEETAALPPDPGAEQVISKQKYFIDNLPSILGKRFGAGFAYKNPALAIEVLSLMLKLYATENVKVRALKPWRFLPGCPLSGNNTYETPLVFESISDHGRRNRRKA